MKISNFSKAIGYQEKKINQGDAELIGNTTFANDIEGYIRSMNDTVNFNTRITTNRGSHIAVSLPEGENLTNDQFVELSNDYLIQMGFENCPYLLYRNHDTTKEHIHIIVSNVNYNGSRVGDRFEKRRSQQISRNLENKYNLKKTEYKDRKTESLKEVNSEKYKYQNAIKTAFKHPEHEKYLFKELSISEKDKILTQPLDNTVISLFLGNKKNRIFQYLKENNLIYKTKKQQLIEKLEYHYTTNTNRDNFLKSLEKNNIYARVLINKNNQIPYLVYGLKEENFYLKEKNLPSRFKFYSLEHIGKETTIGAGERPGADQKEYLKRMITRTLRSSSSVAEFTEKLQKNDIKAILDENKRGIYGISFSSANVENPIKFKGSELNRSLSWNNISLTLQANMKEHSFETMDKEVYVKEKTSFDQPEPILPAISRVTYSKDDSEDKKKKKKKGKRSNQNDRNV